MREFNLSLIFLGVSIMNLYSQNRKPNIIILTADDLGWNDISSNITTSGNGSKNHQTPNIDRLINEGMAFTNAYTQQNSAPTRAALLTGMYANHSGVYNVTSLNRYGNKKKKGITKEESRIIPPIQNESIDPSTVTIAEVFRANGYENYIFGKVHGWKGDLNINHGFNHDFSCSKTVKQKGENLSNYFAYKTESGYYIFDNEVFNKYAEPYSEEYIRHNLLPFANGNDPMSIIGKPKHFTDALVDCFSDQLLAADNDKPFFMWVCFHAIHSAIESRDDLYEKYNNRNELDERHKDYKYAALTEQLDQAVGRIMAAIDDPNGDGDKSDSKKDNTIILFMSDNGGVGERHSNAPLKGAKGMHYEGGIRVPMCVRYPGVIKGNSISNEPVHVIDYLPTLSELTNSNTSILGSQPQDGISFASILTGGTTKLNREALYWHFPGYLDYRLSPSSTISKRINDKRYKLRFEYENDKYEMYCLDDDPSELLDLLVEPNENTIMIARNLRSDLCKWISDTKPLEMRYKASGEVVPLPKSF